jgi:hypothetical protein
MIKAGGKKKGGHIRSPIVQRMGAGSKKKGGHIRTPIYQFNGETINEMNVLTKYPIVVSGSDAETQSDYRRTYAGFNGLSVQTKYPIVTSTSDAETLSDYRSTYSAYNDSPPPRRRRSGSRRSSSRNQSFGRRTEAFFDRALRNPFVQKVLGQKLGVETGETAPTGPSLPVEDYKTEETKKGLSTGAKVAIGIGVVAVIGVAAYFLLKKKKNKPA